MSESLGEQEMLWEQVSVSTTFSSSPKLSSTSVSTKQLDYEFEISIA